MLINNSNSNNSILVIKNKQQANFMDPQLRILLEITHEAIIGAGQLSFNFIPFCYSYSRNIPQKLPEKLLPNKKKIY